MSYLGDTLTVGLILVLLFGSISLYLYARVQQSEQKISLLESIVLDLKLTGELQTFQEPPPSASSLPSLSSLSSLSSSSSSSASSSASSSPPPASLLPSHAAVLEEESLPTIVEDVPAYKPFEEDEPLSDLPSQEEPALSAFASSSLSPMTVSSSEMLEEITIHPMSETKPSEYEALSLKELQSLARSRGLMVEKGSKKQALVDALRKADSEIKPGSLSSPSFVEAHSAVNDE